MGIILLRTDSFFYFILFYPSGVCFVFRFVFRFVLLPLFVGLSRALSRVERLALGRAWGYAWAGQDGTRHIWELGLSQVK
ncbi:hypothetical protein B0J18DRAFT_419681 [Chaetomium sp. MPI-SDFR-AT-0129]|nr:hypothetical protein B0J18DRAFT_419681 [Chaetomium sp. MPI-SDFR-AT-0129]